MTQSQPMNTINRLGLPLTSHGWKANKQKIFILKSS